MTTAYTYILDKQGEAVPEPNVKKWAEWFEHSGVLRQVALTEVGQLQVSTIFLGFNPNIFSKPALLWETMIFGGKYDHMSAKYTSKESALAGHEAVCKQLQEEGQASLSF
jgi:hypothetical protein